MLRKILIIILCAAVTTTFALFAASEVMAQDPSDSCYSNPYTITAVRGPAPDFLFPVPTTCHDNGDDSITFPCYRFEYIYEPADQVSKFDHVFFEIPWNPYDPKHIYDDSEIAEATTATDWAQPCEGGTTNAAWLKFGCTSRVLTLPPEGNRAVFYADDPRIGEIGTFWTAGKKSGGCDPGIIGPGYKPERVLGAFSSTQCVDVNGSLFLGITRSSNSCDPLQAQFYLFCPDCDPSSAGCITLATGGPFDITGPPCTDLDGGPCPECVSGDGGASPTYYEYEVNGRKYTACYDLDNPPDYTCSN